MEKITIEEVIDYFIEESGVNEREKVQLEKLLRDKWLKYTKENEYKVKQLQFSKLQSNNSVKNQRILLYIQDIVATILQKESRDKKKTAERLRRFITYLNENYGVGFDLEEGLPKVFSYEAERQLDLLKTIQEPQTKNDLLAHYAISDKTLSQDLSELEMGKSFLGQHIKIDRLEGRDIRYVSSVHPVFMAMNLSEVFSMTVGLMKLGENTSMKETYTHMAHTIYNQLSPYAQKLIKARGEELGIYFREDKKYRDYRQEKNYKESNKEHALLYAVKSGERCQVTYTEEGKLIEKSGYIKWRGNARYLLIESLETQESIHLDQDQILYIEMKYK